MRALLMQMLYERLRGPGGTSTTRFVPAASYPEALARARQTLAEQRKLLDAFDRRLEERRDAEVADEARTLRDGPNWHY